MGVTRLVSRAGTTRHRLAVLGVLSLLAFCAQLMLAVTVADAASFTGGFSPRIIAGGADLNGNNVVNGRDDANAFYGDTHIIDGMLDCDAWGAIENNGSAGDGVITSADDCTLVGVDGTLDGVTIDVLNGEFQFGNRLLPTVFNAADPDNPDIGDSDFAWSAIAGRVDSNGNETIDGDDCHLGLIGRTADPGLGDPTVGVAILGDDGTNPCGFATPPGAALNGLVDLNGDSDITVALDTCRNSCFFGHDLRAGKVQAECPGSAGDPRNDVTGTAGRDTLVGTAAADIICGFGGNDILRGLGGNDRLLGGSGWDVLSGGFGRDRMFGQSGNDRVFGGRGNDLLNGGLGRDRCVGGLGTDTFERCEIRQR